MHLHEAFKFQAGRLLHLQHEDEVRESDVGRDMIARTEKTWQRHLDRPGKRVLAGPLVDLHSEILRQLYMERPHLLGILERPPLYTSLGSDDAHADSVGDGIP